MGTKKTKSAVSQSSSLIRTTSTESCDSTIKKRVEVHIKTDRYPEDTSWEFRDSTNAVVMSGGSYTEKEKLYTNIGFLNACSSYSFNINDSYGDGICCSVGDGYYSVFVDG